MLRNVKVAEYIEQRMKDRVKRTEITQDKVLQSLQPLPLPMDPTLPKWVTN